jgi:Flp pilus assembly protein TadB
MIRTALRAGTAVAFIALAALMAAPVPAAVAAVPPRIVIILLDNNISPAKAQLADEQKAEQAYVRALPADVEVGLIVFNTTWKTVLKPTPSRAALAAAVTSVQRAGYTSNGVSGALARAVKIVDRLGAASTSRLLVLTNGEHMSKPSQTVPLPVDVITWRFDGDDYVSIAHSVAAASGGHVAAPGQSSGLVRFMPAKPHPTKRPAPAPAPAAQPRWHMTKKLAEVLAVVFVSLFVLTLLLLRVLRNPDRRPMLAGQIERYGPMRASGATPAKERSGTVAQTAVGLMQQVLKSRNAEPRLALRLDRGGLARSPAEWALLGVCVSVGLVALLSVLFGNVLLGVLLGVPVGWLIMRLTLDVKIARRRAAFDEQLPNVLQLVAGSLQTGFSLAQALDGVVREGAQPAAGEFARALAETRLGVDIDVSMDGVADRLQSADLRWVIMAVRIQRETGGNLADVLRNTVATMRERAFLRRQVRTLSAEGRLSAYILLALPILVGGWLFYSDPSYMRPLYTTFFGVTMLTTAAVLFVLGAIWMRNLINIKV